TGLRVLRMPHVITRLPQSRYLAAGRHSQCAPRRRAEGSSADVACRTLEPTEKVLREETGNEFAAAADAGLVEDGLDVVAHGVAGEAELCSDVLGGQAAGEQQNDLDLPLGQAVGLEEDGREIGGPGGLDDHADMALAPLHRHRGDAQPSS